MNARSRKERAILRQRRRDGWAAGWVIIVRRRSIARQKAAGLLPDTPPALAAARLALLFQAYSIGDGIAYVPNNDPRLPRAGDHTETLGPTGSGKTYVAPSALPPINSAYWMDEQADAGDVDQDDSPCEADRMKNWEET